MKIITDLGKIFTGLVKNISEKIAIICAARAKVL